MFNRRKQDSRLYPLRRWGLAEHKGEHSASKIRSFVGARFGSAGGVVSPAISWRQG